MAQASRDQNFVPVLLATSNVDGVTPVVVYADPVTHRLLVSSAGGAGTGTVTSVSIVPANGFSGSVATSTTTPAITITTTLTGLLKGNGTALLVAVANTDYQSAINLTTTGSSGVATFDGTTLNIPNYAGGSGTVTSVALTVPTGLSIAGSPVTTSGTLAITLTAGHVIPTQASLDAKAPFASPTFTGTVSGITATMVGLGNVTNTSDANKPVSTAQQTALNLKANLASPTFTGTPTLPTGTIATTQSPGNDTTRIATTAFTTAALALKANIRGAVNVQTGTTYTLVIGDEFLVGVTMNNAAANTITIPTNATVAFPIGTAILITQLGAGATTIAAAGGVTTVVPAAAPLAIGAVGGSRVIQKRGTDSWLII